MSAAPPKSNWQPQDPYTRRVDPFMQRVGRFWQRVTEGLAIDQLWSQFRSDARASYRLYSKDVDTSRTTGIPRGRHFLNVAQQFFWAILEKLTPARRVLLLIALVLVIVPGGEWTWQTRHGDLQTIGFNTHFWGGLLMFLLLMLEVGDRVVMKRDLQIAKEIQNWLLPSTPPHVPGLELAFATRPANTVAGDYYDVFARSSPGDATYLIAVADVAGKSIPAALLMATFQASLKTLSNTPVTLTELVSQMNHYACGNSENGRRFTTAFFGEYNPANRSLTYVNAGHNPPILRRKSGGIERLESGGVPLGILNDAVFTSATVTIEESDWVAVFTDGVIEAENEKAEEYGEPRLMMMLHSYAALAPPAMLSSLMSDIDRFVGTAPQHDDITCLLIKGAPLVTSS